jgi:hypothetical protein
MLTDRQVKNLPATRQPYRKRDNSPDPGLRGFGVQVSATGTKTFYVEYSFSGRRGHFYRLGTYPGMSLADARNRCREIRKLVDDGIDPKAELERRRLAEVEEREAQGRREREERATALYEDLSRLYLESVKNETTRTEIARLLDKDARPVLKGKRVTEITPSDIRAVLGRPRKRGAKRVERMLHCYLHAAFAFAKEEQELDGMLFPLHENPVAAVKKPDEGMTPRDRVLSQGEISTLWNALETDSERISPFTGGGDPVDAANRPTAPGDPTGTVGPSELRRRCLALLAGPDQDRASAPAPRHRDDGAGVQGDSARGIDGVSARTQRRGAHALPHDYPSH